MRMRRMNNGETNENSPAESTDGTQKNDEKKDPKKKNKEKKPEDHLIPRLLVFLGPLGPLLSARHLLRS